MVGLEEARRIARGEHVPGTLIHHPADVYGIRITITHGASGYYATSPDLKGMLLVAPTMEVLEAGIMEAVEDLRAQAEE